MSDGLPLFSIIIPTYGRQRELAACLRAIVHLEYPQDRFEVIVVDDGNERPLDSIVSAYRDQVDVRLVSQQHAGPAVARNTGAARARGRFLAFTDDDCIPARDWLGALNARLVARPNRAVGGRTLNMLRDNLYSTASQMLITYLYTYYNVADGPARFLTSNNLAMPADLFFAVGGFNTTYTRAAAEDRELCDRWRHYGYGLLYAPEAVVYHCHRLTLRTFLQQHFNYGRGAFHFLQARARRIPDLIKIEPLAFYSDLLHYPFSHSEGVFKGLSLMSLLFISQVVNATGFFWEKTRAAFARPEEMRGGSIS